MHDERHDQFDTVCGGDKDGRRPVGHYDEFENDDDHLEMKQFSPDWQLIDEISIKLLECGIGTFETLQRALPSVVLAQIERIVPDSEEKAVALDGDSRVGTSAGCSGAHLLKLFRLAQLQIDYLLKTQQGLVERLERAEKRASRFHKENRTLREAFFEGCTTAGERRRRGIGGDDKSIDGRAIGAGGGAQWGRELFRCNECSKVFLHANFLADHILRKHSAEGGTMVGGSLRRLVGVGGGGATSPLGTKTAADTAAGEMAATAAARGGANATAKKLIRRGNSQQGGSKKRFSKKFGLTKHNTTTAADYNFSLSIGEEIYGEEFHQRQQQQQQQQKMSSESSSTSAWR